MESSTPTEEFQPPGKPPATPAGSRDVLPSVATASQEKCPACGSAMAADQRYCVECGQRRGPARVPFLDGIAQPSRDAQAARSASRRRGRRPLDATLIAGVGTLLLAMGIGVLIGRSSNSTTAKSPRVQVVTVAGGGSGSSTGATGEAATASTAAAGSSSSKSKAAAGKAAVKANAAKELVKKKAAAAPQPKVVTVGSPGHGPGYQNGHFTGNFFGP
jgi:hypothetical protein